MGFLSHRTVLAALFLWLVPGVEAQRLRVATSAEAVRAEHSGAQLMFSENGALLYVIGTRVLTYNARSMMVTRFADLEPGTQVFSISPSGPTALIGIISGTRVRLGLFDMKTGRLQDLPSSWYDADYNGPDAAISGNGRLISVYSENGPADQPMTVTIYNWPSRTLAARRWSPFISAGGIFGGGVTVDGFVEFVNNRTGRNLVELKTGRPLAMFSFSSVRSADGSWVVEFPNRTFNESSPKDVIVKTGSTGEIRGRLEVQIGDDEAYDGDMNGAFCGTTGRFVLARRNSVAVYSIPSGGLLANLPAISWQGNAAPEDRVRVACSSNGGRVAVLSGARLTIHELR